MGDWLDEWGCWDAEDFILSSVNHVEWRLENLDNYIHFNNQGDRIDIRKIDNRYAKNLFNWFNKHLKEAKEELDDNGYIEIDTSFIDDAKLTNKGYLYLKGRAKNGKL